MTTIAQTPIPVGNAPLHINAQVFLDMVRPVFDVMVSNNPEATAILKRLDEYGYGL